MAQTIQLVVNTGKSQTSQTFDVTQGGIQGQPLRIQAVNGARYQLQDPAAKNTAPQNLRSKRVGKNLHISLDGSTESDLIIEGYYDAPPEAGGQGSVYGRAEDGKLYEYVPQDGSAMQSPMALNDGGPAVNQTLGGLEIEDYELSTLPLAAAGGGLGGLTAGVLGAAAVAKSREKKDDLGANALAKIEAYNNGNGTTPAALTLQDYLDAGVTGVTASNLAAVNAKVLSQNPGAASTAPDVQALVNGINDALVKIESYNNGDGVTPPALTAQDYADAGITGVTADNLAAVNAQVLAQSRGGADTVPEVAALVTAANAALAKIEAYGNGNGTTPAALTEVDYRAAGITGVNAGNLAAINAKVLGAGTGDADTATEVQNLVTRVNDAMVKIEAYNNGDGITPPALTVADYDAAGVTGVTADNLAAVNAQVLAQSTGGADTVPEVQALVSAADTALAKIEAYNNGNGTTPPALTETDYRAAGITGVNAGNLAAINAKVLGSSAGGTDTATEVQNLVTHVNDAMVKIEAYNNGDGITPPALTVADYDAAGITGVTADNLAAVNAQVLAQSRGGADTVPEVQALVSAADTALAKIEAYNNGNGTTPPALTEVDYRAAGITGVNAGNLAAVNEKVLGSAAGSTDSATEVQNLVTRLNDAMVKIEAYNNGDGITPPALTVADYDAAGITGVTADNLAAVNAQVLAQSRGGADTVPEVQALVTAPALTAQDYADAGITGVSDDNLAAVNAQVLAQSRGGADTVPEVQTLVAATPPRQRAR